MFCKFCGNQLSDDAIFCPKCGKQVERESAPSAAAEEPVAAKNSASLNMQKTLDSQPVEVAKNEKEKSAEKIKQKLQENGLGDYIQTFDQNHLFDESVLFSMTNDDYISIGVSAIGDRKKILSLFSQKQPSEEKKSEQPAQEEWVSISKNGRRFVYKPSEPNKFYCPKCHSRVADTDSLCSNCNESLVESNSSSSNSSPTYFETSQSYSQNRQDEKSAEDEDERLMEAYCRGKPYFINAFKKIEKNGKNSWNWAAFIFNMWYLCYKKMWGWGFLVWIIMISLQLAGTIGYVISLGMAIVCGVFANRFYYQRYQKLLSDCKAMFPTFEGRKRYLYNKGGSSAGAVILILLMMAGYIAFGILVAAIIYDGYSSVNNYYY